MVDFHENVYLRRGAEGRAHIPPMPFWIGILRVVQLVFSLVVLVLCAYASSVFGGGYFAGYGLGFFIFVWTILFLAYTVLSPLYFPKIYIYWIQLILEFKTMIFWLATFALLAEEAAAWNILSGFDTNIPTTVVNPDGTITTTYTDYFKGWKAAIGATKAAAAFGAFAWASFCVTLVVFGMAVYKHRKADGATTYASQAPDAEKGAEIQQPMELREVPI